MDGFRFCSYAPSVTWPPLLHRVLSYLILTVQTYKMLLGAIAWFSIGGGPVAVKSAHYVVNAAAEVMHIF
jgi:hypothetical protein